MTAAMKEGEHYGRIPGCGDKPTLLKPGAEKLCLLYRLAPAYEVQERPLDRGHREYRVMTTLTSITTQRTIGQGVGCCSSMENKFRLRAGAAEITDRAVPRVYWEIRQEDPAKAQDLIGGKGFVVEKVETDNPADSFNTVLEMAKKRALVDAVLTTTAASDIFAQDLEEFSASLATSKSAPSATRPTGAAEPAAGSADPVPADAGPQPSGALPASEAATLDFRHTPIHFGKNRGLNLTDLSPQQIHWYEAEWMPKKEAAGIRNEGDQTLVAGLKAYRLWREAEKAAGACEPAKKRRATASPPAAVPAGSEKGD
ncbi:MAG: hypothetical protein INR62_03075 [Rhodospirillales bacterium]|nr:hypothetical protein [Acetobacter sp.]